MPTTITPQIVNLNTTVVFASEPSQLQQSGALISLGGTTLTAGTYSYCGNLAAATALIGTAGNFAELTNSATTFFAQGQSVGVYLLELGPEAAVGDDISILQTWITDNPGVFYVFKTPAVWDGIAGTPLGTMLANYESPNSQVEFVVTTTATTISQYATNKAVVAVVPSPNEASTENQASAVFYQMLVNNPSASNQLAPMAWRYLYGVTPWPSSGQGSAINTLLTAYGNVILTGAQGGISNATLFKGTTASGAPFSEWYGLNWFQINVAQQQAAAIFNGSNSQPPLLFNQHGINILQGIAQSVANNAVIFGCAQAVEVSATPFSQFVAQNPTNYASGIYNGFSASFTGQTGFLSIDFNINAVQFA
ncbi:MAG: hypothetical protein ACYDBH_01075 [Acidobacteriaceae bacterium]